MHEHLRKLYVQHVTLKSKLHLANPGTAAAVRNTHHQIDHVQSSAHPERLVSHAGSCGLLDLKHRFQTLFEARRKIKACRILTMNCLTLWATFAGPQTKKIYPTEEQSHYSIHQDFEPALRNQFLRTNLHRTIAVKNSRVNWL